MTTRSNTPQVSVQRRLTRLITLIVTLTFVVVGIAALLLIRSTARSTVSQTHDSEITRLTQQFQSEYLADVVDDLRQLANSQVARRFAGETITVASRDLEDAQANLLGEFILLAQSHPGAYVAIRYVTRSGSVWTQVLSGDELVSDSGVYLNQFSEDEALSSTLRESPGTVIVGSLLFETNAQGQRVSPPRPLLRFSAPVSSPTDTTNIPGAIQIDVAAAPVFDFINNEALGLLTPVTNRRLVLVNALGQIFADSATPNQTYPRLGVASEESSFSIQEPELDQTLRLQTNELRTLDVGSRVVSVDNVSIAGSPDMPWRILLIDDAGVLYGDSDLLSVVALVGAVALGVGISAFTTLLLNRTLRPLGSVAAMAQRLATAGKADDTLPMVPDTGDEIGQLVGAFQQISNQVTTLNDELTNQVGRYSRNIEITARIARETAALYDIDKLLNRAINLIVQEFGYYHAQVFLVDDIGANAVLFYSYGEAGERLLQQQHRIVVGSESVIGRVTASGKAVIVNDTTGGDAPHRFNPLLPDTRAEMALPLQTGSRVIGALDIQSRDPDAFQADDERTFQLLADQIAIAIQNARLLLESEERIEQIDTLNRQLTRMAWEEAEEQLGLSREYHYNLFRVTHDNTITDPASAELSAPITVRGEIIGTLAAQPPATSGFTEGDELILRAVADRVALAIENARLFQETQASLAQTSILYQISRYLNEADSLEDIVQAIIVSVMPDAISGQVAVFDEFGANEAPEWMEITADWMMVEQTEREIGLLGVQLRISDHPLLNDMRPNQVTLVNSVERDERLDEVLRAVLRDMSAGAAVFIPFSVRGIWRGIIIVEFPEAREFGEREGRIYSTLIDQAGVAIDNRLLLRQTELALSQIERLYAASRIINTANSPRDLIRAAVSTTSDPILNFALGLFEGELDSTGWSTRLRIVARSERGDVVTDEQLHEVVIAPESPLRYREPQIVIDRNPDEYDISAMVRLIRSSGSRFGAAFPLFSANQPIALFLIVSSEPRELSPEDYEVYRALTGQMSTVLENRRLLDQTAQYLDETRRLYAASRAIAGAPTTDFVYRVAVLGLSDANEATTRISILLAGPTPSQDAPYLEYAYVWSRDPVRDNGTPVGMRVSSESAPYGRLMARTGGAVRYDDLARDLSDSPTVLSALQRDNAVSAVLVPVQSSRNWLGIIICQSDQTAAFDEQFLRFAQAIADQIAIALENRQLFEEAQLQAQRALALAEAGQLASRIGSEFEENIGEVFSRVAQPANYDRWLLMLTDPSGNFLERVTQHRTNQILGESGRLDLRTGNHSLTDSVRLKRTIIVNEPGSYPGFAQAGENYWSLVGKHLAAPIFIGDEPAGVLMVGRALNAADLDDRDEQLANTLAAQVAIAIENRRLFVAAETERSTLSSTLATLPAGVLVLDAQTYKPLQYNEQAVELLGRAIDRNEPFTLDAYNIYRTGTAVLYPINEMPIFNLQASGGQVDDVAIIHPDGSQTDLLVTAAPIFDARGGVNAIVAAFTDISNLRSLENTLQQNLRDTISLYEATQALSQAGDDDDVLDIVIDQLAQVGPTDAFILLLDEQVGTRVVRSLHLWDTFPLPDAILNARQLVISTDTTDDVLLADDIRAQLLAINVQSFISMPMRARSRRDVPIGWIVLTFNQARYLTPEEERFLTTLDDSAAIALDNRYLFRSTEQALRETAVLYDATTSISRVRDLSGLGAVLQTALQSLNPDLYAGYLFENTVSGFVAQEIFNDSMDSAPVAFGELLSEQIGELERSLYIEDLRALTAPSALEQALMKPGNVRAVAMVNLRVVKESYRGCLILAYHQPHQFGSSEARYLSALADSASVVLDNVLLFEQIQSTLDETSVLYQASRALGDATTPEDILDVVVSHLIIDESITLAFLAMLYGSDWYSGGAYVQVASSWQRDSDSDLGLSGVTLTAEQFPAWRQLAASNILLIPNTSEDPTLTPLERMGIESLDVHSIAVVPLRAGRRAIGAILLGAQQPHEFSERDLRIFQSFAEQASIKLEAARLLMQTERRARQLATSAEVSRFASTILDLTELLPRIVDLIKDSFGYDHAQIFLMDPEDDFAELRASTGEAGRQLLSIKHKLQKGSASVIGQVTAKGEPAIALDTADANVVHRPNPYLPNTRSEMAVPLIVKGRVVGALDVQSNQPNAFDEDDVSVLTTLAAQVSVAIDNARLFEQSRQRANEMSFLFGVTTTAASAETLTEALQSVAEEVRDTLDALAVTLYLPEVYISEDDETRELVVRPVALAGSDQPLSELSEVNVTRDPRNLIATVADNRRPTIITNIENESRYLPIVEHARSAIIVPLTSGPELIGLVTMESEDVNAYDNDTVTLMLTLSGTLSAIVQNQRLLEQLQISNDQLRELDRLKSDFLANMSHELRTPLNSIIGFSRVILKGIDGPLTEMQEQDLSTIYQSGQHLLNLINDILDQAKISAGKMDLQTDYFEIKPVIDGVRSIGIGLVKDKPIDIRVDIASGLPKAYGDEFRTRQVLLNLVSNAAKFTREGSITIRVYQVRDDENDIDYVRIDVTDTGIGIADKDLPLLFEAFRQVDSSLTRTQGGTGLGLPIAKSLVEMQGGQMFVESQVNIGSTFSITVPIAPPTDEKVSTGSLRATGALGSGDETTVAASDNGHDTVITSRPGAKATLETESPIMRPPMLTKRQILIIEDNPDMVDQFRRALQREGFDIFAASIPLEAEAMASGLHPTIIILDVNFANGVGWNILNKMKSRDDTLDIPIIVVSLSDEEAKVMDAGAFRFIRRPFMPEALAEAVRDAERESRIDRILIIDDQPESVRLLTELLQEYGDYRVFSAHNGQEGVALVARRRPNLILLDLRMPEMDGFSVVQELRSNPETATIPILVVTGESLTTEERQQLNHLQVMFKTDITLESYQHFIQGVKTHLSKNAGE